VSDETPPIYRLNVKDEANFDPLPEYNGHQAWLYKSEDGKRRAGSFKEHGRFEEENEFDEFIYIVAGSTKISVDGAEPYTLVAGECTYLRKGTKVTFEHDDEFHDVAVLIDAPDA
jgi:uncharacterized cupin superfamily protein